MQERNGERGFTLIEMMVVVAIIAVLVAILVPNFIHARAQAQTAACEANIKEIATAAELYFTDNSAYPATGAVNSTGPFATYLKQTPIDPSVGSAGGTYTFTSTQNSPGPGEWSYSIQCPGAHDASTLQSVSPGTTKTRIYYQSTGSFSAD